MVWFKLCPRCNGDLMADRDEYGKFIRCMQCGLARDMPNSGGMLVISADSVPAPVAITSDGTKLKRHSHGGRRYARTVGLDADTLSGTAAQWESHLR